MLFRAFRSGDAISAIIMLALSLPAIVLCLSVHEASHGAAAYLMGDRTAQQSGRVTLSPLAHIDPFGFLCLLLFGFGWARPVPVDMHNFKHRRAGIALTSLAGPLSNLVTAFLAYILYLVLAVRSQNGTFVQTVCTFLTVVASMSVGLGVFNLIPVPPLDGSHIVEAFLPYTVWRRMMRYRTVFLVLFVVFLYFGWLDRIIRLSDGAIFNLAIAVCRPLL